jgi:ectoine hydroxylase-related dioxygenase (phytanoyl-CoA dioxygenase family)
MDARNFDALAARYAADGVVKVPALVSPAEAAVIGGALNHYLEDDPGEGNTTFFGHGPGKTTARWIYQREQAIPDVLRSSGAAAAVARIIGAAKLSVWYDVAFIHEPREESVGTQWHHDIPAFPFKGERNPSLWVALSQVTMDSSPLQCLKGSHKDGVSYIPPLPILPDGEPALPDYVAAPDFDRLVADGRYEVLSWTMNVGDCLIIHPYTVHGAPGNRNKTIRRTAYSVRLMGSDCRWQPDFYSLPLARIDTSAMRSGDSPDRLPLPVVYP